MNWSLVLNAILLVAVLFILIHMLKKKDNNPLKFSRKKASLDTEATPPLYDDIIAVRKIDALEETTASTPAATPSSKSTDKTLMLFLLAKPERQLAGYEMLQTLLSAGLRFGEGQLFHRHESKNGKGPILCSLAAATKTGTFDLQNIGAFHAKGLCLYMHVSGDLPTDTLRLTHMLAIAEQLSEGLDTLLLDAARRPLTPKSKAHYHQLLTTA